MGGPGRRLGGCCYTLGFGSARGLPGGMVMCLCCTRFPRTILSRANSIQQSTPHKASYLPHCASPALERLSHRKAAASPTPLLPRVGSRHKTPTVMCSKDHAVLFALEPAILRGVSPVLSLCPYSCHIKQQRASGAGEPAQHQSSRMHLGDAEAKGQTAAGQAEGKQRA